LHLQNPKPQFKHSVLAHWHSNIFTGAKPNSIKAVNL